MRNGGVPKGNRKREHQRLLDQAASGKLGEAWEAGIRRSSTVACLHLGQKILLPQKVFSDARHA